MFPPGFVQDLLSRVDIADVVGRHVELRRMGANLMGLCPFHAEKSPSFSVNPGKQFYYCFGCGAGGNALGEAPAVRVTLNGENVLLVEKRR